MNESDSLDMLFGAAAIAKFLFGDATARKRVYHLAEVTKLPIFRVGSILCARESTLLAWIAEQEKRGAGNGR